MAYPNDPDEIQEEPEERRPRRNNVILILLSLFLLGSVAFNVYQYYAGEKQEEMMSEELVSSESLRQDLQQELDSALAELDEYRGRMADKDSTIAERERELLSKAEEIEKLLASNKISYNKYLAAKDEVEKFRYYAKKYLREIETLTAENQKLTSENQGLQQDVKQKTRTIDELTDVNVGLRNKVTLASQLQAESIMVDGVKFRKSGRERETSRASQIEKLRVCFTIPENRVATAGTHEIYIQILDPKGQTLAIEALGSGTTTFNGEEVTYTFKEQIQYNNDSKNYCMYWGKDTPFEEGKYTINIYTGGYVMGQKAYVIN